MPLSKNSQRLYSLIVVNALTRIETKNTNPSVFQEFFIHRPTHLFSVNTIYTSIIYFISVGIVYKHRHGSLILAK